ncbi:MAG: hypothetical protein E6Q73_14825 [Pseudorhodobacter sp.]|nr:MAG: hypothetical protein E6Q73_14825 [Pseudorhodobacter sp.]
MKVLCLLLALATPACAGEIAPIALDDPITFAGANVVALGEIHDNPTHHTHQARAVAALRPKALVFEMLTAEQAAAMPQPLPDAATLAAALQWDAQGWPDFALYYPIFAAAPTARVYGAGIPRDMARKTFDTGIAAQFGPEAKAYGLTTPLAPADQSAREAEQSEAHCNALPPELLPGMVAVQRLRDAALARAVVQALADTGGPVAVITGNGHARRDQGLAVPLARVAPDARLLSLAQFEEAAPETPPYDLWLTTPAAPRPDPCLAFQN